MEHADYFEGNGGGDGVGDGGDITQDEENTEALRRGAREDYEGNPVLTTLNIIALT